jgi:hypothetical protein
LAIGNRGIIVSNDFECHPTDCGFRFEVTIQFPSPDHHFCGGIRRNRKRDRNGDPGYFWLILRNGDGGHQREE